MCWACSRHLLCAFSSLVDHKKPIKRFFVYSFHLYSYIKSYGRAKKRKVIRGVLLLCLLPQRYTCPVVHWNEHKEQFKCIQKRVFKNQNAVASRASCAIMFLVSRDWSTSLFLKLQYPRFTMLLTYYNILLLYSICIN